jgi:hypothetical protein
VIISKKIKNLVKISRRRRGRGEVRGEGGRESVINLVRGGKELS